jgi:hypothetical protein
VHRVDRDLVRNALFLRLQFVEAHPRHFRIDKGRPRNDAVIGLEAPELTEQGVDAGEPCLMRRDMSELIGTRNVASGKDVRIDRGEIVVGHDRLVGVDAKILKAIPRQARLAANRHDQGIIGKRLVFAIVFQDDVLFARDVLYPQRLMADQNADAGGFLRRLGQFGHILVLAREETRTSSYEADFGTKTRKGLRKLAADRPTAEQDDTARDLIQLREGFP